MRTPKKEGPFTVVSTIFTCRLSTSYDTCDATLFPFESLFWDVLSQLWCPGLQREIQSLRSLLQRSQGDPLGDPWWHGRCLQWPVQAFNRPRCAMKSCAKLFRLYTDVEQTIKARPLFFCKGVHPQAFEESGDNLYSCWSSLQEWFPELKLKWPRFWQQLDTISVYVATCYHMLSTCRKEHKVWTAWSATLWQSSGTSTIPRSLDKLLFQLANFCIRKR